MRKGLIVFSILFFALQFLSGTVRSRTLKKGEAILDIKGKSSVTVKVGAHFCYSGIVHGSVGKWLIYKTEGDEVLSQPEEKLEYLTPDKIKAGMKGADKAKMTYIFEALKPGKVTLHMIREYRYEEESRESIVIVVEP
jgi:hypothetical protein